MGLSQICPPRDTLPSPYQEAMKNFVLKQKGLFLIAPLQRDFKEASAGGFVSTSLQNGNNEALAEDLLQITPLLNSFDEALAEGFVSLPLQNSSHEASAEGSVSSPLQNGNNEANEFFMANWMFVVCAI